MQSFNVDSKTEQKLSIAPLSNQLTNPPIELDTHLQKSILSEIWETLKQYVPNFEIIDELNRKNFVNKVFDLVAEDLICFSYKDPAAKNSPEYVWETCLTYRAVFNYRIAHQLHSACPKANSDIITPLKTIARKISEDTRVKTAIEIHPSATIGRRFVVDHGTLTVIGETVEIGDDCYILQGVTLGGTKIVGNKSGKRHPTLGNRVQVGGFVRIYGAVVIGDDVTICPDVEITSDIPPKCRVKRVGSSYQYTVATLKKDQNKDCVN